MTNALFRGFNPKNTNRFTSFSSTLSTIGKCGLYLLIMAILLYPNEILRQISVDVKSAHALSTKIIIRKLVKNLSTVPGGVGLSAPQIGNNVNIFIMNLSKIKGNETVYINPQIIDKSPENISYREGCLSFPGLYLDVESPKWITLKYTTASGVEAVETLQGLAAVCANHEVHHLFGELFIDRKKETK